METRILQFRYKNVANWEHPDSIFIIVFWNMTVFAVSMKCDQKFLEQIQKYETEQNAQSDIFQSLYAAQKMMWLYHRTV
jgi:hypothetical protein